MAAASPENRGAKSPATARPGGPAAVQLETFRHLFTALTEEMGAALRRAAFSPNIKERRDYSCALFNPAGVAVAVGDHMPVHLGAMPMSVEAALAELGTLEPGDVAFLNDPFRGGTHLPDITTIAGVFAEDVAGTSLRGSSGATGLIGYVAARAHHSDVGGSTPGSMPLAREIYEEGLRIPPIRIYARGVRNEDAWRIVLANVRTPVERA
jgi:N-methylhydantoinase B